VSGSEAESRVVLGMSEHDNGGVATSTALLQTRAYQLTSDPRALMIWMHGHRRETGDTAIG